MISPSPTCLCVAVLGVRPRSCSARVTAGSGTSTSCCWRSPTYGRLAGVPRILPVPVRVPRRAARHDRSMWAYRFRRRPPLQRHGERVRLPDPRPLVWGPDGWLATMKTPFHDSPGPPSSTRSAGTSPWPAIAGPASAVQRVTAAAPLGRYGDHRGRRRDLWFGWYGSTPVRRCRPWISRASGGSRPTRPSPHRPPASWRCSWRTPGPISGIRVSRSTGSSRDSSRSPVRVIGCRRSGRSASVRSPVSS